LVCPVSLVQPNKQDKPNNGLLMLTDVDSLSYDMLAFNPK